MYTSLRPLSLPSCSSLALPAICTPSLSRAAFHHGSARPTTFAYVPKIILVISPLYLPPMY